jgi:hypothetical protein
MVGTFLPWMGAWTLANQTAREGRPSVGSALGIAVVLSAIIAILAILLRFPGAHWTLGTFAVAFLPGLVLATIVSAMGKRRS